MVLVSDFGLEQACDAAGKPDVNMADLILLSFDAEEFDIPEEFGRAVPEATQFEVGSRGLRTVLDLLDRLDVRATFFTTARIAEHAPDLVRRIVARHELASHGYHHSRWDDADLVRSREALEALGGGAVTSFRRARFAPTDHRLIAAAGYRCNSSENPIWMPGRYNNLGRPRVAYYSGELLNVPISASPVVRLPLFWLAFKNFPQRLIHAASSWTLRHDGYLNVFWHPWEFVDITAFGLPGYITRRCGQPMLDRLERYIRHLQPRGRFATFTEFDAHWRQHHPPRPA